MRVVGNRRMKLIVDEMVCIILCSLLWGCERRELTYYMEAEVTVTADWSCAGLEEEKEEGATLIIFPQDGSAPRIVLTGEREHTTVRLPLGTYDAVFLNRSFTDFNNLLFRGYDALESLEAYAKDVETRASTRVIVSSPDKLASATIRNFEVTGEMLGNYVAPVSCDVSSGNSCKMHFTPIPLVRRVQVTLNVRGLNNVRKVRCTLNDVPLSVFLHSYTAKFPRITATNRKNNFEKGSDLYLINASYLRLKNIEIGYNFDFPFMRKLKLNSCRMYVNGYNLLTFTAFDWGDPESRQSDRPNYPLTRVFNIGLKLGF